MQQEDIRRVALRFFSDPLVGFLGTVFSIIGVVLTVYLFFLSRESPGLTYFTNPARAVIVKSGQTSQLSVAYKGATIMSDISVAQVAIWNSGAKPVRQEDMRRPLYIYTEHGTPILEATVRQKSREVVQFDLDGSETQGGRVKILWDMLEKGDGGVVQLIYTGGTDIRILADGVVVGQGAINSPASRDQTMYKWYLVVMSLPVVLFMLGRIADARFGASRWARTLATIAFWTACGGMLLWLISSAASFANVTPFGF